MAKEHPLLTLELLLRTFKYNPNIFIADYEIHQKRAQQEYATLEDYSTDTLLSSLAQDEGRLSDFAKWRLVELWREDMDMDINAVGDKVYQEIKKANGWEGGKEFMDSVVSWDEKRRHESQSRAKEVPVPTSKGISKKSMIPTTLVSELATPASSHRTPQEPPEAPAAPPAALPAPPPPRPPPPPTFQQTCVHMCYSTLRLPITWFFRAAFYIGVVYFLVHCLLFLIKQIPVLGPAVVYLVNRLDTLILAEPNLQPGSNSTMWLWISGHTLSNNFIMRKLVFPVVSMFTTPVKETGLMVPIVPLEAPFYATMNHTQDLAKISLLLLPMTRLLLYSSYSLERASVVVGASDLKSKADMSMAYDNILEDTRALEWSLSEFDNGVEALIRTFSLNLQMTLNRIHEIVDESNARHANPVWELMANAATLSSSACTILPPFLGLSPWASIICGTSFFLSAQGHCYSLSIAQTPTSKDPLDHPICLPTRYFRQTNLGPEELEALHTEAGALTAEFRYLVQVTQEELESLRNISRHGLKYASAIHKHHTTIDKLRRQDENSVRDKQGKLNVKAQYKPTWFEQLRGQAAGLHQDEKYEVIKLDGQWRDLKELATVHNHARFFLEGAVEILGYLDSNLRVMDRDIDFFIVKKQRDRNSWRELTKEMEMLAPLVGELDGLITNQDMERKKESKRWREKWDFCIGKRRAAAAFDNDEMYTSKGWEDCMFFE